MRRGRLAPDVCPVVINNRSDQRRWKPRATHVAMIHDTMGAQGADRIVKKLRDPGVECCVCPPPVEVCVRMLTQQIRCVAVTRATQPPTTHGINQSGTVVLPRGVFGGGRRIVNRQAR